LKKNLSYLFATLILGLMLFFGSSAYKETKAYEQSTLEISSQMSAKKLAVSKLENLAESLSLGYYKNGEREKLKLLVEKQKKEKANSLSNMLYYMALLLILLLAYKVFTLRVFTALSAIAAFITLIFGLITPMMMVTIHKEIEYLGDVVLSFESKGVIGSVLKLFENGDLVVAVVIFLFSVLIPLLKTTSLLFVSIFMENQWAHKIVHFFKMIGKWSMVDVFVVSLFLVFLAASKGDVSRAEIEAGLYFFLAYVFVSVISSLSADKMLQAFKD